MIISVISPSFYPAFFYGGPIFSTYYAAKELAKLGSEIFVSTTNANGSERLNVPINTFTKHSSNFYIKYYPASTDKGFSLRMIFSLWKDIKPADVVYTQSVFSLSTPFVFLFSKLLNKPVLFSPRGELGEWCLQQGNRFKKQWLRFIVKPFAHYINWHVTGEQEQHDLLRIYPDVKSFLIPNGIDLSEYSTESFNKTKSYFKKYSESVNADSFIIVSMGRLHAKKGFDILISSFSEFIKYKPNSFLFIAGEDYGEKEKLLYMVKKFSLNDKVFLVGQINDIKEKVSFLSNADLFALSSNNENFGIVYAEALAAGTAVIASKDTPWSEIENLNCGSWTDNTKEHFAEAMSKLSDEDVVQMGRNGRKFVFEKYDWEKIGLSFFNVYKSILNK